MISAMGNKLVYGIVVAIVSVLVIVALSIWQYRRVQDMGVIIRHANQILTQTQAVQNAETQYELNVKNFLLTGDSSFLKMAGDTLAVLPEEINRLKTLATDYPDHQALIDSLTRYVVRNGGALEQGTVLSRSGNFEGTAKLIGDEAKYGSSHKILAVLQQIESEERRFVDVRRSANLIKASELQWVLWALSAAVVILALVTFRKIRLDLLREKKSTEKLHRFNTELEAQVRLQTANLQAS